MAVFCYKCCENNDKAAKVPYGPLAELFTQVRLGPCQNFPCPCCNSASPFLSPEDVCACPLGACEENAMQVLIGADTSKPQRPFTQFRV